MSNDKEIRWRYIHYFEIALHFALKVMFAR